MDRDNASTATQADHGMTRRGVMRGAAIGIGATAAGGIGTKYAGSPVGNAEAVAPLVLIGAGVGLVSAGAAIVAYGQSISGPTASEVSDSLSWQSHVNEYTRTREDQLMLEQTVASLKRDIQLIENKAREQAIFKIYEQGVDSGTESTATTAAEQAINDAYATVEKAIYNSWNLRFLRMEAIHNFFDGSELWEANGGLTQTTFHNSQTGSGVSASGTILMGTGDYNEKTVQLLDGTQLTYNGHTDVTDGSSGWYGPAFDPNPSVYEGNPSNASDSSLADVAIMLEPDPADYPSQDSALDVSYSNVTVVNTYRWYSLLADLHSAHSNMMSEVSSMVNTYFQPAKDGEIDLTDIQGPKHLTDAAENAQNYGEAALALDAMGFSVATSASILSVEVNGETSEFTGKLARSVENPNPLPVGVEIDPSTSTGSIYAALNQENENGETSGAIVEVTEPFTIKEAENGADEIIFEKRKLAEADSLTNEEIEALFAENYQAREDARETVYKTSTSGGGGGFLSGGSDAQTLGIVAGGAALAALLFGNN